MIGAHPDDIELNAGATAAKLVEEGHAVHFVVASYTPESVRGIEGLKANAILGVHGQYLGMKEPNMLDDFGTLIQKLEHVVNELKPDMVYTHHYADTHQDHEAVCRATMVAARFVGTILMYYPTYPSGRINAQVTPNVYCDVAHRHIQLKMAALSCFKSQITKYGDNEWLESVTASAKGDSWRYSGKHGYTEVFSLSRMTIK